MRKATLQKQISATLKEAQTQMAGHGGGMYARGLASEGWLGGFCQGLRDVQLLLNDVEPNDERNLWRKP